MKKLTKCLLCYSLILTMSISLSHQLLATADRPIDIELPKPIEDELGDTESLEDDEKTILKLTEEELTEKFKVILTDMIDKRNGYILHGDDEGLKSLYNTTIKLSSYAYESEATKLKYLNNWAQKQCIKFNSIESILKMRKVRDRENGLYGMTCNVSTEFSYSYSDTPEIENKFKLGTSHYIHLKEDGDKYIIVKEWYTDPFADSLDMGNIKSEEVKKFILEQKAPTYEISERTKKAIEYAHKYCGIGENEQLFKYNKDYIDCNPRGGDCANFASQILHEGGGFKKNGTWNYDEDGTKAWVNAQAFKNYIVSSGRGGCIAKGSYNKVYKAAYQLRPGDFVAYEKKGRITHISTVTGLDSKGYPLVTCHNTDRLLVPYDLGWSNKSITFHLIDVYY
ncbi:MAG: amidase domain-containing protein [Cellulosilyticaceae bacterium]